MFFTNYRLGRLLSLLLSVSLFANIAFAAAKSDDKADKVSKFNTLSTTKAPKGIVTLDDSIYEQLIKAPRDYTAVVLLTALDPRYGCQLCRDFQPEYELIAKSSYGKQEGGENVYFGSLDFSVGRATFQKLQLATAPVILVFFPTSGPNAKPDSGPARYDFAPGSTAPAENIANWLSRTSNLKIVVVRPFNWQKLGTFVLVIVGGATALKAALPYIAPILYNRNLWAALSLIAVLLFTSGHMFNHIRKVPYVTNDGKGGVSYIAGGFSNQFGLETQIIAVIYAVLSFCTISLALKTPRIEDPRRQQIAVLVWNLIMLCLFSFLLNIFKIKNGSYPFFLPPIMS